VPSDWRLVGAGICRRIRQPRFGFIRPDDRGGDVFFHVSALREGDEIIKGAVVTFEIGADPKSGKSKAVSVDLA
jgi:cold shock protein